MAEYIFPTSARGVSDNFDAHRNRTPPSVNPGTDYTCGYGTTVVAVKAGTVNLADSNNDGSGGRMIGIDHGDGSVTQYLHLSELEVSVGQHVEQGQEIAKSGASGFGSDWGYGAHLHIALKINGSNVDFEKYVDGGSGGSSPASSSGSDWEWNLPSADVQLAVQQQLANRGIYNGNIDGDIGPISTAAIQQELTNAGYYSGTIDGVAGPLTCGALQAYARDRGGYDGPQDKVLGPRSWNGFLQGLIGSATPATPTVTTTAAPPQVKEEVVVTTTEAPTITVIPDTPVTDQKVTITPAKEDWMDKRQILTADQYKTVQDAVANIKQDPEDDLGQYDLASVSFWNYAGERVIKTFAMTFASMLSTTGAVVVTSPDTANVFAQIGWMYILTTAGVSALTSLLVALSSFKNIVTIKK